MKFLLVGVNAKYIHTNPAIYSLKAYGEAKGAVVAEKPLVELAEYTINHSVDAILEDIYRRNPRALGLSCYIWNWKIIRELLGELPKLLSETDIWLGGPEASFDAPQILKQFPQVKGIMTGEGEGTFRELLTCYGGEETYAEAKKEDILRKDFSQISGLCLPAGYTRPRELLELDEIPFPYPELSAFAHKIIYYESSRGCPFGCSYCLSSLERKVRFRSLEKVKKELQIFLDYGVKQVKFVDRTFNCNPRRAREIWKYLLKNDNGVTNFHFEIGGDLLEEEDLELLGQLRPGLVQFETGVQSVNPRTLEAIHRNTDLERLAESTAAIGAAGTLHQHLDLIAGLPYEDYESFGRSFDWVYGLKPQQLQLGFLKVLKGSEMYRKAEEYGICSRKEPPYEVLYTKWLSYEEVVQLKKIEQVVEIYYNSNQYVHTLPFLERIFASPFQMFEALAQFFDRKGYFLNSPARSYRYEILLAFAGEADPEREKIYRELLTFDMYLREKCKSRPPFAKELTEEDKHWIREYQKETKERQMCHIEPFDYPVWEKDTLLAADASAAIKKNRRYVRFDYTYRSPLDHGARIQILED